MPISARNQFAPHRPTIDWNFRIRLRRWLKTPAKLRCCLSEDERPYGERNGAIHRSPPRNDLCKVCALVGMDEENELGVPVVGILLHVQVRSPPCIMNE